MGKGEDETEHIDPEVAAALVKQGGVTLRRPDESSRTDHDQTMFQSQPPIPDDPEATRFEQGGRVLEPDSDPSTRSDAERSPLAPDRTAHAQEALRLALRFVSALGRGCYGRPPGRVLRLPEPEEMSTDRGKKARHAILLAPGHGDRRRTLVCGWIDSAERAIELRRYEALSEIHLGRFALPFDLLPDDYAKVVEDIRRFARTERLAFELLEQPAGVVQEVPVGRAISVRWILVLVAAAVLLGMLLGIHLVSIGGAE